ncbi:MULTISPECIES: hypothetical protein [unclassified Bradyrhizobium]|uniref:hypothetical protein n=1 Tax=unclassified Bradyrhizobium TaxID=2631580 RepID=UPI003395DDE2
MSIENIKAAIAGAKDKSRTRRAANIAKGNPTAWRKVWEDALRVHYPESVVQYTDRVQNNLKQAIEKRGLPYADMGNFIGWIVMSWPLLRQQVFSFNPSSPRGPEVPDMKAVVPFLTQVHGLYMRSKPEVAANLPLAARRAGGAVSVKPPVPSAAKAAPAAPATPLRGLPIVPLARKINHATGEAARQRLGLPKWDDKR